MNCGTVEFRALIMSCGEHYANPRFAAWAGTWLAGHCSIDATESMLAYALNADKAPDSVIHVLAAALYLAKAEYEQDAAARALKIHR